MFFTDEPVIGMDCITKDKCKEFSEMTNDELKQGISKFPIFVGKVLNAMQ